MDILDRFMMRLPYGLRVLVGGMMIVGFYVGVTIGFFLALTNPTARWILLFIFISWIVGASISNNVNNPTPNRR